VVNVLYQMSKYLIGYVLAAVCRWWEMVRVGSNGLRRYDGNSICENLPLVRLV